ncbi:MAG TPA: methyltransferase [Anaerolineales bacterium]|nr:methyltransferase [Anaerolineales bacterium]
MHPTLAAKDYSNYIEHIIPFLDAEITIVTKPGFPNWNVATPACKLFSEYATLKPGSKALLINSGNAVCCTYLAGRYPEVEFWLVDTNIVALESAEKTVSVNELQNVTVIPWAQSAFQEFAFDTVFIEMKKGRKITRRLILEAFTALKPGGKFYIAGANRAGIKSAIEDVDSIFGNSSILGYKKGNRLCLSSKLSPNIQYADWAVEPGVAPGSWYEFHTHLSNLNIRIKSLPGVFSYNKIDEGTQLLLENILLHSASRVLDIGCGWGSIGLTAAIQGAQVDMVDVDLLAIWSTNQNMISNQLSNASIFPSDITRSVSDRSYNLIASNPPFHSSIDVDYTVAEAIVFESYARLETDGKLWLVTNYFLPYHNYLLKYFGNYSTISTTKRYKLLCSTKK